jgi:hypothetical protein
VYLDFWYQVIRAWQLPLERVLTEGLGLVPLAMLTDEAQADLPAVVRRMDARISGEVDPTTAADLWAIAGTLAGLRIDNVLLRSLLGRITHMKESSFFQYAGEEMSLARLREALLRVGKKTIGEPGTAVLSQINAIRDIDALELLIERAVDAPDWESLLAAPESAAP